MRQRHITFPDQLDRDLATTARSLGVSVSYLIRSGAKFAVDQAAMRDLRLSATLAYDRVPRFDFDLDEK